MSTQTTHHVVAALLLSNKTAALITYANTLVASCSGDPLYASLSPTLTAVTKAAADLQVAEATAATRVKGATAVRNEKRAPLVQLLRQLLAGVQAIADAHPDTAESIIRNAGLAVKKAPTRLPRTFTARPSGASGAVRLVARSAGPRAAYEWSYSLDGGKTWLSAPVTVRADTVITGLPPGTLAQFRYRVTTKAGEGPWSAVVTLAVQ